ncbi:zinc-ribbon domain-containing protein [Terrabacter aerolatus]|uniref:zinc-ribbon domain-containing protein n=1 Tax=Terrabacter aerolatus TaxID=422442 RepID=UPI001FE929A5|nr:zinc-ribbon domain-containing protein [Terrabacter aerolatus]
MKLWAELVAVLTPVLGAGAVRRDASLNGVDGRRGRIDIAVTAEGCTIAIEYDGEYWHRTRAQADARKSESIRDAGYNLIRVRESPLPCAHPDDLSTEVRDPLGLASLVLQRMLERAWLTGAAASAAARYLAAGRPQGVDLAAELLKDVAYRDMGEESLQATHPALTKEWDHDANGELTARHVTANRHTPVWWRCELGDSYQATPSDRARRGRGCPYCRGKRVNLRNCLATTFPHLAAQLAVTNPFTAWEIYGGGHTTVYWQCPLESCRHVWPAEVKQRTQLDTGCPACAGKVATPDRNLRTERYDVAAIWHPTENLPLTPEQVLPGCNSSVTWLCPDCDKPFPGVVLDRCAAKHQCCPRCAKKRAWKARSR